MHILFLGWGSHIHLKRWAEYFANAGHRVTVLSIARGENWHPSIRVVNLHMCDKRDSIRKFELWFWIKRFKPDICHIHWAGFAYYLPGNIGCPYGVTAWGSDIYGLQKTKPDIRTKIINGLRNASFITCDSMDLKREINELMGTGPKVSVIQWGVETDRFIPNIDTSDLRKKLEIPDNHVVIYSPRSVDENYNIDIVIEAFSSLVKKHENVILIQKYYNVDPARLKFLKQRAAKLGADKNIRWVGEVNYSEIPMLNCLADFMISIPRSDGTPMALLEAMACGLPPIVSSVASVEEWIEDGVNGIILEKTDAASLERAILKMLNDSGLRSRIRSKNLDIVKQRASHTINMGEMEKLYFGML